jgi:hypothetical protein
MTPVQLCGSRPSLGNTQEYPQKGVVESVSTWGVSLYPAAYLQDWLCQGRLKSGSTCVIVPLCTESRPRFRATLGEESEVDVALV